tara:strand:+ start:12793 stop:13824 length:1032 start_codon:yes stop_codon:yes gene_type:complete
MSDMSGDDWTAAAGGVGMMAAGFGDLFLGDEIEDQKAKAGIAQGDIDQFYKDFEAGKFDATMSPQMLKYFSMGRQGTDLTPALESQATTFDFLSQDPRGFAANIPAMSGQYSKSMMDIANKDFERELSMIGQEGQAYQGLNQANLDFLRQIYGDKLQSDQLAYATALQNQEKMEQAKRMAIPNIIMGGAQTAGALYSGGVFGDGKDGMKIPEYQQGGDVMAQIMAAQGQGGVPARQDLPGPESHDTNPISMVAPDGKVVGEATGGEIILNGEQTESIEQAVELVDDVIRAGEEPTMNQLMAVYEAVSKTLSQPQFQDEPQQGGNKEQEMMRRMEMMLGGEQMA